MHTDIHQRSDFLATRWDSFNIAAHESVQAHQPRATSRILIRVDGGGATNIAGSYASNGITILENQNGVQFSRGAIVNVGGLLATSSRISGVAGAHWQLNGGGGAVVNHGEITAGAGGVVLAAVKVQNTGDITSKGGDVALGAGSSFTVDFAGSMVGFEVKQGASGASLANSGKVEAQGGIVSLSAHEAQAVRTHVVSVGGVVRATKMERRGGVVYLSGGDEGIAEVSGDVHAGEKIQMTGEYVVVKDGATLQAPEILVGGDYQGKGDVPTARRTLVEAGALLDAGQNGRVIVWSDETTWFDGRISAPGGFAEVSGKKTLASVHLVGIDVGHLLLDPEILNIVAAGDDVTGDIAADASSADGTTNISVSSINNFTGASLTLSASRSVRVRAAISHANLNLTLRTENSDGAVEQNIELRADIDVGAGTLSLESGVVTIPLVAGAAVIRTLAARGLSTSSISGLIPSSIHIRFTRAGVVGPGEGFAGGFARVAFGAEVVRVGYSYGARTSEETATDCSAQEINCTIGRINENVMAASTRLTSANSITINIGTGNLDFTNAPASGIVIGSGSVSIKAGGILIGARGLTIIANAGNLTLNTGITGAGSGDVVALSSTNGDLILGSQDRGVDFALEGRALTLNAGGEFIFVSGAAPSAITAQAIELSGPNLPQRTPAASVITFTPRPNGRVTGGGGVGAGPLPLWLANNLDQPTQTDCSGQPTDCTIRRGGRDLEISTENLTATSSITIDIEDGALTFSGTGAITISAREVTLTAAMINLDGRDLTITGGGGTLQLNLNADIIAANTLTFGEVSESFILTLDAARTLAGANISFLSVDEITVNHALRLHSANTLILTSNIYTKGAASDLTLGLGGAIDLRYAGEVELDSAGNLTIGGKITTDLDLSVRAGGFLVLNADIVNTGDDIHLTGTRGIILNGDRLVQNDSRNVFVESGIDDSSTSDLNLAANDSLTIKATGVNSQILFRANVNLGTGALSLTSTRGIQRNAPHITLAGGDITLPSSFTNNGVTRSFTVMASGTLTLNGITYSAPDSITLSGTQGIMLGSQNTQLTSSAITITAPTLNANGRNLTITGSGAALTLNLNADITNVGTITIGEANHSLTLTLDAARTLTSTNIMLLSSTGISVQQSLHLHASGTLTLNSNLSATSGSDLTLGLPETETGPGMISLTNVGFYQFTGGGKLTINSALIADYSVIINFAAADSDGVIELNADITGTSVSILLDGPGGIVLNGDRTLEAAGNITLRGAIDESAAMADENGKGGNDGLTVTTTGQLTLSSNINTGTGALTLRGGTISLNGGGSMRRIIIQGGTTTLTGVLTSTDNGLVVIEGAVIKLNSDIHTGAGNLHLGDISSMIILGGDITLTGRTVTIGGAVDESAAQPDENGKGSEDSLTIVAGDFITLSQDINLGAGTLTLIAGPGHSVGRVQPGSELTLAASTVSIEQGDSFPSTFGLLITFMTSVLTLNTTAAQIVYGWMTQSDHDLKIIAGGDITIGGLYANMIDDVDVGTGDLILDSATQIVLYEDITLTGGAITLTGAIEGAGSSLTINAGGMLTLNSDINLGAGDLMITAHALSMSGAITITADPTVIEFTDLAIQMNSLPADTAQITFQGDASPDYIFAQSQTDCIVAICVFDWDESNTPLSPDLDAQTSITINADNAATPAANDGRLMFSGTGAITIDAPVITINAALIDTQGRRMTITASGGALTLNADLTSAGGLVELTSTGGAIILGGDINAGTGDITLSGGTGIGLVGDIQLIGAAITLTGTIDESSSGNDGLTTTATGQLTLNSNINTGTGNLILTGASMSLEGGSTTITLRGGNIRLTGALTSTGPALIAQARDVLRLNNDINIGAEDILTLTGMGGITLGSALITLTGGVVSLTGAIDESGAGGSDSLTVNASGDITLNGDINLGAGALALVSGMGSSNGNIMNGGGGGGASRILTAQSVSLTQDAAFASTGMFTFASAVLLLDTGASQTVHAWMTQGDRALSLTSAITIMVEEDVSTGTSDLTLAGNGIILSGGARTLSGANIALTGAAASMADLTILATGTLALNSSITTQGSASDLSVTGGGGIIVGAGVEFASGHDLTISGAISAAGTSGDLTLTAAGTAELGGDINLGTGTLTIGTGSSSGLIGAAVITAGMIDIMFYNNNVASASDVAALGTTITFANSVEPAYVFGAVDCKNHHPCVIEGAGEIVVRSTLTDITRITITATGEDSKVRFGGTGVITLTAPEVVITANMIELEGRALMIVDPGGASLAIGGNIAGAGTITIANNGALAFVGESIVAGGRIDIIAGMISTVNRADGINTAAAHSLSITASEDLSLTVSAIDVGSASGGDLTLGITGGTGSISAASAVDITASVVFLTHGSDNQNSMTSALLGSASNVGTLGVNVNSADQETADWMFAAGRTTAITNHSGTITVASEIANHSGAITLTATNGASGGINVFENITSLAGGLTLNSGARPIDFGGTGVRKIIAAGITLSANSITASGDLILEAGTAPLVLNSGIDAGANSLTLDGSVIDLSSDLSSSITLTGADIRLIAPISERADSFTFTVDARGTLTLDNDIDLGAGSLVLSGAGIALGRDITLEGMAITLTGAISETADDLSFTITAGGVVTLNSDIELTGDTGTEISITARGGEIMNGGLARTLTANRVGLVQSDEFSSSAPFIFSSADTLNLTTNLTTGTTQAQAVWPWMVNGNLNLSLTSTGAIEIRTDISTGAGSLVLAGASIALPLAGNFTLRGFTIELAGAIDANSRGLTINASGNLTLNNDINLGTGALALTAERIRVPSAITMTASAITIGFTGAGITSASEGFVGGQTSLDRVIFTGISTQAPDYTFSVSGLGCDDSVICRIGNGSAALNNVSSSLSASGSITIDAGGSPLTFAGTDAITIAAPTIEITASVINIGSRNLTITSTGGALTLNGRIEDTGSEAVMLFATGTLTLGGNINIRAGALTLSAGSIELGADITLTGASISLTGAIDESGAGGNDNFTVRLAAFSSGSLLLSSNINLGTGSLVLLANTRDILLGAAITLTGGDISLTGRIDQSGLHRNFTANASDMLTLNDDIDLGPNSLVLSGANGILLLGNITLTSQTMTITAPMIDSNGSNLTLTGGGGGGGGALTLNLNADITDAHNLTIGEADQNLTLNLDAARTLGSANIMLLSSAPISVARALELNYSQALTLSSDLSTTGSGNDLTLGLGSGSAMTISLGAGARTLASGGDLVIGSAINSSNTLILMAGGAIMLHAKITLAGVMSPSLTLTGSSITLNAVRLLQAAGSVELTGAIDEASSGNEDLTIIAGGDITINSDINLGTGRLVLAAGSGSSVGDINNGGAARVLTAQSVSLKQDGAFAVLAPFTFVSVGTLNLSTSLAQTLHDWMTDGARALSLTASGTIRVEEDVSVGASRLTLIGRRIMNGGVARALTASTVSLRQVEAFGENVLFTFAAVGTLDLTTSATQTMQAWMAQGSHSLSLTSADSIMVGVDVSTGAGNLTLEGAAITFSGGARTLSGANISLTTDTITHSGPNLTITAAGAITTAARNDAAAVPAAAVPSVTAFLLKLTQAGEFGTDAPFVFASVGALDLNTDAAQTMRSWMTDGARAFSLTSAGTITIGEDISTGVGDLTLEGDAIIFSGGARTLSGANILLAADTITHNGQSLTITATGDIITANRDNTGAAVLTASGVSLTQAGEFGERTPFAFASVETLNLTTDATQTLRPWMTDAARFLSLTSADTIMIGEDVSRGDGALILAGTAITFSGGVRTLSGADITLIGSVTSAMALTITATGILTFIGDSIATGTGNLSLTGATVNLGRTTPGGVLGTVNLTGSAITLTAANGITVGRFSDNGDFRPARAPALVVDASGVLTIAAAITSVAGLTLEGAGAIVATERPRLTASTLSLAQIDAFAADERGRGLFRFTAGSLVLTTRAAQDVQNWMIGLNSDLTLTSALQVRVGADIGADVLGRDLGTGSLTLVSTGADIRIEADITTTGNITLSGTGATGIDLTGGARILRGADLTLTGAATSDQDVRVIITGLLTLNGDIDTGTHALILRGGAIRIVGDETDANTGTRTLTGGAVILGAPVGGVMVGRFDSSGVFLTDGPALEVEASGTVRIAADIMTGGDVMLTGGGVTPIIFAHVLTLSAASIMLNSPAVGAADLTLTTSGALTINNSITLTGAGHTLALRAGTGAIGNGGARRALMASTVSLAQVDAFGSTRDFGFAGVGSLVLTTEAAQEVHNWMVARDRNLTVTSAGSVFVRSAIGAGVSGRDFGTGSLTLTSTASFILVEGNITTSGDITLSVAARLHAIRFENAERALMGADIMLTGNAAATADLTISATGLLTLNSRMIDTGTNALTLTGDQINILSAPTGINAGTRILRGGDITLMATRRVRVGHIDGNEAVFTGGPDLEVEASGTLTIAANITAHDAITLQSGAGAIGNGGQVRTLRILSAGSDITLRQVDAFGSTPLFEFGTTPTTLSLNITGSGAQTIHDWMAAAIIDGEKLVVNSAGRVLVEADIDLGARSLTLISRASFIRLRGNITTTGGLTLSGTATPENPAIRFDNAARALSGRDVLLLGNVGISPATSSGVNVIVTASGTLNLNGVINTGASNLALTGTGGIFLLGALTLSGRDITLTGAIAGHNEGNHMLAVTAIGLLRLRSNINTGTGAVSLTGAAIQIGRAAGMPADTRILLRGQNITLTAANGIQIGRFNRGGGFRSNNDVARFTVNAQDTLTIAADITVDSTATSGGGIRLIGRSTTATPIVFTGARTITGRAIRITGAATGTDSLTLTASGTLTIDNNIDIGTNALTLTSGAGAIVGTDRPILTASTVRLRQVDMFDGTQPFNFGTTGSLLLITDANQDVHDWMIALDRNLTVESPRRVSVLAEIVASGGGGGARDLGTGALTLTSTGGVVRILANITTGGAITLTSTGGVVRILENISTTGSLTLIGAGTIVNGGTAPTLTASTVSLTQAEEFVDMPQFIFGGAIGSLVLVTAARQDVHNWMIASGRNLTVTGSNRVRVLAAIGSGNRDLGGGSLTLTSTGGDVRILADISTGGDVTLDASGTLTISSDIDIGTNALTLTSGADAIVGTDRPALTASTVSFTQNAAFAAARSFGLIAGSLEFTTTVNQDVHNWMIAPDTNLTVTSSGRVRVIGGAIGSGVTGRDLGNGSLTLTSTGGDVRIVADISTTGDITLDASRFLVGVGRPLLTASTVSLSQTDAFAAIRPFRLIADSLEFTTTVNQDVHNWMIVPDTNLTVTSSNRVRVLAAIGEDERGRNLGTGDITLTSTGGAVRILANISTGGDLTLNGTSGINLNGRVVGVRTLAGAIVTLTGNAWSNRDLTITASGVLTINNNIDIGTGTLTLTATDLANTSVDLTAGDHIFDPIRACDGSTTPTCTDTTP